MESESLFLSYVRSILKKWVGFQAAIDEGMGGPYAKEKELWLGTEIENYFKNYSTTSLITPDDIEEYLETMIEQEFNTYFEDGSTLEVSKAFCEAYELFLVNPDAPIFQDFSKKIKPSLNTQNDSVQCSNHKAKVTADRPVEESKEQLTINGDSEEDEWTVVTKKNRKK